MKNIAVTFFISFTITLSAVTSRAFDGNRKGFVVGGGVGFAPTAINKSYPNYYNIDESSSGLASNFIIGYAWNELNMIVYEGNAVGYSTESGRGASSSTVDVYQGFSGFSWYHYFGPVGKSAFITGGYGRYVFFFYEQSADLGVDQMSIDQIGGALQIGAGYEFARHWQFGGYLGFKDNPLDSKRLHFSILVGGVAF
jgi:hypothetical protein